MPLQAALSPPARPSAWHCVKRLSDVGTLANYLGQVMGSSRFETPALAEGFCRASTAPGGRFRLAFSTRRKLSAGVQRSREIGDQIRGRFQSYRQADKSL